MLQNIGLPEIIVILLVVLVFFGPEFLKTLAQQLGLAGKELKNINKEYNETVSEISKETISEKKRERLINSKKSKKKGGEK